MLEDLEADLSGHAHPFHEGTCGGCGGCVGVHVRLQLVRTTARAPSQPRLCLAPPGHAHHGILQAAQALVAAELPRLEKVLEELPG